MRLLLALILSLAAVPAAAQSPAATHLVVFNRPGPAVARAAEMREAVQAHYDLYRGLAERGEIIVGGRMDREGAPAIGLSVFRAGVDRDEMRRLLEADPSVEAGITEIEFREWHIQMGALPGPPRSAE